MRKFFAELLDWLMGWQLIDLDFQLTDEEVQRDLSFGRDDDEVWPATLH